MIKNYISSFSKILLNTVITDVNDNYLDHTIAFKKIINRLVEIRQNKTTVFLIGNGGSSGVISHASIDLLNTGKIKSYPLTDSSHLTCMANDNGYENVFKTPLETLINSKDALIAVSSSGSSENIVNAAKFAMQKGSFVVTLSGFDEANPLRKIGDFNFWLNSNNYGKVELGHSLLLHIITDLLVIKPIVQDNGKT